MGRVAWSQVRFRAGRALALLLGMALAAAAFTVLTAASRTSQLRTIGTISANFVPAYDILVRPRGARTAPETRDGTVQPDFLSGIYGGITTDQYHQIQRIQGVEVAAPVAMVGYALLQVTLTSPVPETALAAAGRQLYRISTTWVSDGGTSRVPQPPSYLYVTPRRLTLHQDSTETDGSGPGWCSLTQGPTAGDDPFAEAAQGVTRCWSKVNGYNEPLTATTPNPGYGVSWNIPVLIAAIDPAAEARLDGLGQAIISGRYLAENAGDGSNVGGPAFPVLASSSSGMDEYTVTRLEQLTAPSALPETSVSWETSQATAPGRTVATERTTAQQAYSALLKDMEPTPGSLARENIFEGVAVSGYWSTGPASYVRTAAGELTPLVVRNPPSVWYTDLLATASMDDADAQYRTVTGHAPRKAGSTQTANPQLVGVFDPAKIKAFDPLSQVPLGAYQPVDASPASPRSRQALGGGELRPNQNLGGLVSQPVNLITTLSALPALQNPDAYGGGAPASDPISVIRVRVAGVTGPDPVSLERIKQVAQEIGLRTHLDVDIVTGSSPTPTTIDLPAGKFGRPPLTLSENWVKKGVAIAILRAVDAKSVLLFTLILVVCGLFVANSATAAVRGRRQELGVLACLGWTRPRMFAAVMGELAGLGLAAGLAGAVAALPVSTALGLRSSPARAALAIPVAMAIAVLAGAAPAWLATRATPLASVRPPARNIRRGRHPGGIAALAVMNMTRVPGRTLVGVLGLAVGVAALTLVTAFTAAFHGVVVGSLLGDAVAVQVRGVDYVAVTATIALGVLAVADVVFLNIRERATELATIRSFGWRESALARLVVTEGVAVGVTGSLTGAVTGLAAAAEFAGQVPARLYLAAAAAAAAGVVVTAAAALVPARLLRRLPQAHLLAEE